MVTLSLHTLLGNMSEPQNMQSMSRSCSPNPPLSPEKNMQYVSDPCTPPLLYHKENMQSMNGSCTPPPFVIR